MPEAVRLVVWDLDDTFWQGTVIEGGMTYVQAHHDIVVELARRGIMSSICSKNDASTILPILAQRGIVDYFIFPSISWESKGPRLAQLIEDVQLRAPTVMFIDDNPNNRAEAAAVVPGLQIEDETFVSKILSDPRFTGKDDRGLTRLAQYKLLETRKQDEQKAEGGNEEFLRSCDIRVYIEYDVASHLDRVVELINRTNQLNYTKQRLSEDMETAKTQLRSQLVPFDRVAGLVRVADKYGDYGFVGFFMTGGMRKSISPGDANTHLVHFCFSCRTLGMLVEAWTYNFLGRPELFVSGDVLTNLIEAPVVSWIRQVEKYDSSDSDVEKIAPRVLLYGGCEVNAIGAYLQAYTQKLEVYGNYVVNGMFVSKNYVANFLDVCDRQGSLVEEELKVLGLPLEIETGDPFEKSAQGDLYIFNFTMDAAGGASLRHKTNDWHMRLAPNNKGWADLIDRNRVSESDDHLLKVKIHLDENYEEIPPPTDAEIFESMCNLIERVPLGAKVIVISDHHERHDDKTGQIVSVPRIVRYGSIIKKLLADYPFAVSVSVSDVVTKASEIRGGGHYERSVYWRLVQKIVQAAKDVIPRASAPFSKRHIARVAAQKAARFRSMSEAEAFVKASFDVLLRRSAGDDYVEKVAFKIASGEDSYSSVLRGMGRSDEFVSKWEPKDPRKHVDRSKQISPVLLRVPNELSVTTLTPKRVLIVGSCLSEGLQNRMKLPPIACESDLFFVGNDLPESLDRPFADYDFQLVQLALRHILPDAAFARLGHPDETGHEQLLAHSTNMIRQRFKQAMRWNQEHGLLTFVLPFIEPMQNLVGRLMPQFDLRNPVYFVQRLNETLAQEIAAHANSYMVDLNGILSVRGRRFVQDDLLTGFNHGSFLSDYDYGHDINRLEPTGRATEYFEEQIHDTVLAIWHEIVGLYRTVRQIDQVKMVVIDLDDTLWRGVVAELDINNLPTSEGWTKSFWEALLILKRRGILLAIISKNEETRIKEVWQKICGRMLSLDDFATYKINWRPKAENMTEILAHVNLLPRNVVYIDDNPVERAAIKAAFPDIRTLGGAPFLWRRILLWAPETQVANITAESANRTAMVQAQVVRETERQAMPRAEFLASLNVTMNLFKVDSITHSRFPRVLELINKTNQFNTTGKRWAQEECVAAFAAGTGFYAFEIADHYTEYGLVGVLIIDLVGIQQFVMSCRVMGLEAEIAAIAQIGNILRANGAKTIFAAMVETDKNQPCRNIYAQCGFKAIEGGWQRAADPWIESPKHITLNAEIPGTVNALAPAE